MGFILASAIVIVMTPPSFLGPEYGTVYVAECLLGNIAFNAIMFGYVYLIRARSVFILE